MTRTCRAPRARANGAVVAAVREGAAAACPGTVSAPASTTEAAGASGFGVGAVPTGSGAAEADSSHPMATASPTTRATAIPRGMVRIMGCYHPTVEVAAAGDSYLRS
ncbi:MAG: hypothetical protein WAT39_06170 [Planctomycetota bacterium]